MVRLALLAFAVAVVAAGCGGSNGSAFERCSAFRSHCAPVDAATARREARAARAEWLGALRANARLDPSRRFPTPAPSTLGARLRAAALRHDFTIESVRWRLGVQAAPEIVVQADDRVAFVHALPAIFDALDPPPRSNDRAYEGFFIEAVDAEHVPYVAVFDALRDHVMGGQWARGDDLYPFAHG